LEFQPTVVVVAGMNMESDWAVEALNEVKGALRGKILMTYAYYPDGEMMEKLVEYLGVDTKEMPALRIIHPIHDGTPKKYGTNVAITPENILKFYEDWKSGKLVDIPRVQYIPTDIVQDLKILSSRTYHDVVFDNEKDVLVETHTLDCDECKKLSPMIEKVATSVANISDLIVAKFDVMANELEGIDRKVIPALKLYRRNDKENPVLYKGEHKEAKILEWLQQHSTLDWGKGKQEQGEQKGKSQDL